MRLKVLYFTILNITSDIDGGSISCRNHINRLSRDEEIELFVVIAGSKDREADSLSYINSLNVSGKFVAFKEQGPAKQRTFLEKLFSIPWEELARVQSHVDQAVVEAIASNDADVLLIEYFYSTLFCHNAIKAAPRTVLLNQNKEISFHINLLKNSIKPQCKMALYTFTVLRLWRLEHSMHRLMDKIISLAPQEVSRHKGMYITPYLSAKTKQWKPNSSRTIFFVGNVNHYLNKEAIEYIIVKLAPFVAELIPDIRFKIIGASDSDVPFRHPSVDLLGISNAEEVERQFLNCQLFICPFKKNLELRMKILEALSYGTPFLLSPGLLLRLPHLKGFPSLSVDDPVQAAKTIATFILDETGTINLAKNINFQQRQFIDSQKNAWSRALKN